MESPVYFLSYALITTSTSFKPNRPCIARLAVVLQGADDDHEAKQKALVKWKELRGQLDKERFSCDVPDTGTTTQVCSPELMKLVIDPDFDDSGVDWENTEESIED